MRFGESSGSCLQGMGILTKLSVDAPTGLGELDGMRDERERLERLLKGIRGKVQQAQLVEMRRKSPALWLTELKALVGDIEDLLDDFEYGELHCKVLDGYSSGQGGGGADCFLLELLNQVCNCLSSPSRPRRGPLCDAVAGRMGDIWRRYDVIAKDLMLLTQPLEFDDGATHTAPNWDVRETSSFLKDPEVFGRDSVKEEIIDFLVASPAERLSVLAILGIGGLGKTTLAQFVYNDARVKDHFHQKIWVHVSYEFDVKRVTRQIIEHVDPQLLLHQMDNLDVLQLKLEERLRDKRFLLVLDDLWYEYNAYVHCTKWQELCAPLNGAEKGSKILITTRSTKAADIDQQLKMVQLEPLAFDDCWSLLKKYVFPDGIPVGYRRLKVLGKEIVKKLNGVPLAVKTIGSLLRTELEEQTWRSILESGLWELEKVEGGILPALRLSYEHLPPNLKPCFTYFSVFPKGQRFDKLELLQLWMALGYIQSHKKKRIEDVGSDYLTYLMDRSLVQFIDDRYFIHDLLHDLGRFILQHDHCAIEPKRLHKISAEGQHQQHLSLLVHKRLDMGELEKLHNFRKLRTFSFVFYHKAILQVPYSLFMNLTFIRVLILSGGSILSLPDSIGNLRHLRYLDLRGTPVKYLPESMCLLYMLQTLKLQGCDHLGMLPKGMSKLLSLRHLEARHELVSQIHGIGKLVHLQGLDVFSISEGYGIRIEDLRDMDELQGVLCIQNLQRVWGKEEASLANLHNKEYLNGLRLEWVQDRDMTVRNTKVEEAVLDALLPPPKLKELTIECYDGAKSPSWMGKHQYISGLESISLIRCQRWNALPPLVGQFPFLKILDIACLPQLKTLPPLPTTLTYLRLQDVGLNVISGLQELPLLRALIICNILDLRELPPLPATLRILIVKNLGLKVIPEFSPVSIGMIGAKVENNGPFLYELKIVGCQNLKSLGGILQHHLANLTVLKIKNCEELEHWPEGGGFQSTLQTLRDELSIENCPKLMALPEGCVISPSLKKLIVKGCPRFTDWSFFVQLQNLTNLTHAGDMFVEKQYQDLTSCCNEALQQMRAVKCLTIQFIYQNVNEFASNVSLVYDIEHLPRWRCLDFVPYRRVTLKINRMSSCDDDNNHSYDSTLYTCLHHHHLCSSLLFLFIEGMPYGFFCPQQQGEEEDDDEVSFTPDLPLLEELVIVGCGDMGRLPVETLLCKLGQLNYLSIVGCPELTLPSVGEAIKSLPALRELSILECPKMSLSISDARACVSDSEMPMAVEDTLLPSSWCSTSPSPPASSSSSWPPPPLQSLTTDDIALLANKQFSRDHLTSLCELVICLSNVESFQVIEEEWMRSLQQLSFVSCEKLQELPPDFKTLVPSLKALCIKDCPRLRCMPERGLPASLQLLAIAGSPGLEVQDWPKVDHVFLIIIDGTIMQGSYHDYQKLMTKGKAVLSAFWNTSERG